MAFQGASSSPSFSPTHPCTYQVFLNFRGPDTRANFTAYLHQALCQEGINTFLDDKLKIGDELSPALLKVIEESEISIIIFSKNYASSKWCLDELMKILECNEKRGQHVLPVFYHVEPSDVRYQKNSFREGLAELEKWYEKKKVKRWKKALTKASNLVGKYLGDRNEPDFIHEIMEWVNSILEKKIYFHVAQHPVGIDSGVRELKSLLNIENYDNTYFVGIFGIGGIGKTTIAKAIYNLIASQFEGHCFLEDIRETSGRVDGMIDLQNKLLSMILGDSNPNVNNVDKGINLIKQRLCRKRVLLILDGVDESNQLQKLAGEGAWFGLGSRIIITTRVKHLLNGVHSKYQVNELDDNKALQLFSLHAFNRARPDSDFVEVTKDAVRYSGGLPLALTVLGSGLKDKGLHYWKSKLDDYKRIPNDDIHKKLKISYDGLRENAKNIFLHIACFFNGENVEYVRKILDSCGYLSYSGIEDLEDMCLITQSNGSLLMHDLLQEMGREIVRLEYPNEPGKRSRLWFHEDVINVLEGKLGTDNVKGILIDLPEADLVRLSSKAFMEMKRLRLLICRNARFPKELSSLPNELRLLYWPEYPGESLPSNFRGNNLVVLRMPNSDLEGLNGIETFQNLTIMNFTNCEFLKEVPDVSRISKLATLILDGCVRLKEVHHSVGFLKNLVYLSLENCYNLKRFPRSLELESLESLVLYGCSMIKNFPEIECQLKFLKNIDFQYTGIEKLPASIRYLVGVKQLYLAGCTNLTHLPDGIEHLENLECLNLIGCTSIRGLPSSIGCLVKVKKLDLSGCTNLRSLPNSIYQLKHLEQLNLEDCSKIVQFPANIQSISFPKLLQLDLRNCSLSESNFFNTFGCGSVLNRLDLSGSDIVILVRSIERLVGLKFLYLNECKQLQKILGLPPNVEEVSARGCVSLAILLEEPKRSQLNLHPRKPMGSRTQFPTLQSSSLGNSVVTESNCHFILEDLDLTSSGIVSLPTWFNIFVGLKRLTLKDCKQLRDISKLPPKIEAVYAHGCTSLSRFQFNIYDLPMLKWIDLSNCHELRENIGNDVQIHLLSEGHPKNHDQFCCMFPGNKIPDWFRHPKEVVNSNSCEIDVNEPTHLDGEITRIAFSAVIGTKADIPDVQDEDACGIIFKVISEGVEIFSFVEDDIPGQFHSDHVWLHYNVPEFFKLKQDNLQVKFKLRSASMLFKSCGFHLRSVSRCSSICFLICALNYGSNLHGLETIMPFFGSFGTIDKWGFVRECLRRIQNLTVSEFVQGSQLFGIGSPPWVIITDLRNLVGK